MKIKIMEIKLGLDENEDILPLKAAELLGVKSENILSWQIERKAVDARKRDKIHLVYSVIVTTNLPRAPEVVQKNPKITFVKETGYKGIIEGDEILQHSPLIVGAGPAGLFSALFLALRGYKPLIVERGKKVAARKADVETFWKTGELNRESNVQYGEGGAGTFSDGKLTTRIKDPRAKLVVEHLIKAGAPQEIAYLNKPHVGTDRLQGIVQNLRREIISFGGKFLFQSRLTDILIEKGSVKGVEINNSLHIPVNSIILAIGHSAGDTYEMLYRRGINLTPKPFAVGCRIEHPQDMIDANQYGSFAEHPRLGAADYRLTYNSKEHERSAYTFCMCPGGYVIGASSEPGHLVVNGMSNYNRDSSRANSAVVVTVNEKDFPFSDPLSGVEFQRRWERKTYELGGGGFKAPAQLVEDFISGKTGNDLPENLCTYKPGITPANLRNCLPKEVGNLLAEALKNWDGKIKGFAGDKGVLTAIETRTSAPLRILRGSDMEANGTAGLYPAGEGSGYAGGIMSSAVDGIKAAEAIVEKYSPPKEGFPKEIMELCGEEA